MSTNLVSWKYVTFMTSSPIANDKYQIFARKESVWKFDPNASYLISGGLGGLGRTITRWMARKGAKNLILPSRTGKSTAAASELVAELTQKGVNVSTPRCDVSSFDSLATVLRAYIDTMPPIRGCINASMVLQVSNFNKFQPNAASS